MFSFNRRPLDSVSLRAQEEDLSGAAGVLVWALVCAVAWAVVLWVFL